MATGAQLDRRRAILAVAGALLVASVAGRPIYGLKFQSGSPLGLPCPTAATCIGNRGEAYDNGHMRAQGVAVNGRAESEGAMTIGVPPSAAEAAVQSDVVRVGYRMR